MNPAGKLRNWLHERKDASVSFMAEKMLQQKLERYGQIMDIQLNSRERTAVLQLLLKGETEPVTIFVDDYAVSQDQTGSWVTVRKARASREWITQALQEFVVGKSLPIPDQFAGLVRVLL
jgi:hypothetical protein